MSKPQDKGSVSIKFETKDAIVYIEGEMRLRINGYLIQLVGNPRNVEVREEPKSE